jgi:hypothetical protein
MKMLESIGIRPARQARRGHWPQQHRGQAHGADAAGQANATVTICHSATPT